MEHVAGAMGSLILKLGQLLHEEYNLQTGLREQVQSLEHELTSAHATLRAVSQVPPDRLGDDVKLWANDIREASYDMEDVLDTFLVRVEGGDEPPDQGKLSRAIHKTGKLFRTSKARHDISQVIKKLRGQLVEVANRHTRYKLQEVNSILQSAMPTTMDDDPRSSFQYTEEDATFGINEQRDALIKMLSPEDDNRMFSKKRNVLSVVGPAGLGKTTLARAVYDKLRAQFDCGAVVPVGRNPQPWKLFKDILIGLDKERFMDRNIVLLDQSQLLQELREFLHNKRYFIVIDDIWETKTWRKIRDSLFDNNLGSRVIVTTRQHEVAEEIDGDVYEIKSLSFESSKDLFCTRAFNGEGKYTDSTELAEVCGKIIEKCAGVPLAIKTIASCLATKPKREWLNVYNAIGFEHTNNQDVSDMMNIISYSYYDLPHHLRTCLLYLSVYPESYIINKNHLIWSWIAQDFVREEIGIGSYDLGDQYFHELVNRSMILPVQVDGVPLFYNGRVHDMVHRLIRNLSSKENFAVVLDNVQQQLPTRNIRRLVVQNIDERQRHHDKWVMQQVRSYNAIMCPLTVVSSLSSFKVLRLLALEYCHGIEGHELKHVGKLHHLRYLGLINTPTSGLPDEIGNLKFLQTLILEGTGIEQLPSSIGQLVQLMCLRACKKTRVTCIGKLTSLVELRLYHTISDVAAARQFVKELGKLTELRVLHAWINMQDEEQGRALLESLCNLSKLHDITIKFDKVIIQKELVLDDFAISSNLRLLVLPDFEFSRLPEWINCDDLPNLCGLEVRVSEAEQLDMEILGNFPELQYLNLHISNLVRYKTFTCGAGAFKKLRACRISRPLKFLAGAMPRLEALHVAIPLVFLADPNFDFNFGLSKLLSLEVVVAILCPHALPAELEKAKSALIHEARANPNNLTVGITMEEGHKMVTTDAVRTMVATVRMVQARNEAVSRHRRYHALEREATKVYTMIQSIYASVRPRLAQLPSRKAEQLNWAYIKTLHLLKHLNHAHEQVHHEFELFEFNYEDNLHQVRENTVVMERAVGTLTVANRQSKKMLLQLRPFLCTIPQWEDSDDDSNTESDDDSDTDSYEVDMSFRYSSLRIFLTWWYWRTFIIWPLMKAFRDRFWKKANGGQVERAHGEAEPSRPCCNPMVD